MTIPVVSPSKTSRPGHTRRFHCRNVVIIGSFALAGGILRFGILFLVDWRSNRHQPQFEHSTSGIIAACGDTIEPIDGYDIYHTQTCDEAYALKDAEWVVKITKNRGTPIDVTKRFDVTHLEVGYHGKGKGEEWSIVRGKQESAAVASAFTIHPNHTFASYRGEEKLETFHSFVPFNEGYQVVFKVTEKDETLKSGRSQSIETMHLSSSFERNESSRRRLGENTGLCDPRAFLWNHSAYCLAWRSNRKRNDRADHDTFLINLITGEQHLLNDCINGYRGKNWVPLVYREQLYIVHRMSPNLRLFTYDAYDGCPAPVGPPETKDIDQWRGGSAFVPFSSTSMISLGHHTADRNTHIPFLMHVDMTTYRSIKIALLTEGNWTGILDPTSLWWDDGSLYIGTIRTSGSWKKLYFKEDCDECVFNNSIYKVRLVPSRFAGIRPQTISSDQNS